MPRIIDDSTRKKIRELYDNGLNDNQIHAETGFSMWTIQKYRSLHGLPAQSKRKATRSLSGLDRDAIEAHKCNMTYGNYMLIKPREVIA